MKRQGLAFIAGLIGMVAVMLIDYRKLMVDNPDVQYRFSVLDDRCTYRITGTRGDAAYVKDPKARYVIAICARRIRDKSASVDNEALRTGAELSRMVYEKFRAAPRPQAPSVPAP